jgi:hypothetical protein
MARVALWGAFDPARLEDALAPAILRAELERRISGPPIAIGTTRPVTGARSLLEDGFEQVGPDTTAAGLDLVVLLGGTDAPAPSAPAVLLETTVASEATIAAAARVTATDAHAFAAVLALGVVRDVAVVPDVRFLAGRLARPGELEGRLGELRTTGAYPDGDALLVEVDEAARDDDALASSVASLASHYACTPVLVGGAARLADALPGSIVLPDDVDPRRLLAVIAASAGTISTSLGTNLVAAAFDRPALLLGASEADAGRLGLPERVVSAPSEVVDAFHAVRQRGSIADVLAPKVAAIDGCLDDLASLVLDPGALAAAVVPVDPGAGLRALHARVAGLEADAAERETALLAWLRSQSVEIAEEDVRFTRLWNKIHQADRHYHFHLLRADRAEAQVRELRRQVVQLSNPLTALKRLTPGRVARGIRRRASEKGEPSDGDRPAPDPSPGGREG